MRENGSDPMKSHRRCCSVQRIHIGIRQKYVIMVEGIYQNEIFTMLRISLKTKYFVSKKLKMLNSMSCGFDAFLKPGCGSDLCRDDGICYIDLRWKRQESNRSVNCRSGIEHYSHASPRFLSCGRYLNSSH